MTDAQAKRIFGITTSEAKALMEKLTPREAEVAELIAKGMSHKDSSDYLGCSIKTHDVHRGKIRFKLKCGVYGIAAIVFAAKCGSV